VQDAAGSKISSELDVPKMIEKFMMELATSSSKLTSTGDCVSSDKYLVLTDIIR